MLLFSNIYIFIRIPALVSPPAWLKFCWTGEKCGYVGRSFITWQSENPSPELDLNHNPSILCKLAPHHPRVAYDFANKLFPPAAFSPDNWKNIHVSNIAHIWHHICRNVISWTDMIYVAYVELRRLSHNERCSQWSDICRNPLRIKWLKLSYA